jgi:hypothetical protein
MAAASGVLDLLVTVTLIGVWISFGLLPRVVVALDGVYCVGGVSTVSVVVLPIVVELSGLHCCKVTCCSRQEAAMEDIVYDEKWILLVNGRGPSPKCSSR